MVLVLLVGLHNIDKFHEKLKTLYEFLINYFFVSSLICYILFSLV